MQISKTLMVLLSASALLQGCSGIFSASTSEAHTPLATLTDPQSIQPQQFIMRGRLVLSRESRSFTPCNSNQQYWLQLPADQARHAQELAKLPNQSMYGEVIGYLLPTKARGLAADYTARIVVTQINYLSTKDNNQCQTPTQPTRAFGNEPFWNASFRDNSVLFKALGETQQTLAIQQHNITDRQRNYQLSGGQLTMTQTLCRNTMSDELYGWQANLQLKKQQLTGCAAVSNQDTTLAWAGTYAASSTKSEGFSITMILLPDHTAVTKYEYDNGDPTLTETGFWQQLNQRQIQVMMTHHQQLRLISERIFTRHANQLYTANEKVNTRIYPIANGGLTLYREQ